MKGKKSFPSLLLWGALLLWLWPGSSQGVQRSEDPSEAMVRTIARELRCAVCQNQSIYESNSDLAKDMLAIIRTKVKAGEDEEAIRQFFFQSYGDYIFLEPTQEGKNRILWLAPFLGLVIGGGALWAAISRWKRKEISKPEVEMEMDSARLQKAKERIQKELEKIQM